MGLFALPTDDVPAGGFRMVPCVCAGEDADLEVQVDERFLTPKYIHDHNLVFNIEGYGRFRLWLLG